VLKKFGPAFIKSLLSRGTHYLLLENIIRMAVGLITAGIVFRLLPVETVSSWGVITSWVIIFSTFASAGADTIFVSVVNAEHEVVAERFSQLVLVRLIASILSAGISIVGAFIAYSDPQTRFGIIVLSLAWIPQSLYLMEYFFQGKGQIRKLTTIRLSVLLMSFAAKVAVVLIYKSLYLFILVTLFETVIGAGIYLFFAKKSDILSLFKHLDLKKLFVLFKSQTLFLMLSTLFMNINYRMDQLLLQKISDAKSVAGYFAVVRLFEVLSILPFIISNAHTKSMSESLLKGPEEFENSMRHLTRDLMLISCVIVGGTALFGWPAIRILFGEKYTDFFPVLVVLSCSLFFTSLSLVKGWYMTLTGKFRENMLTSLVGALTNIVFNLLLISKLGIWGCVISSIVSYAVYGYFSAYMFESLTPYLRIVRSAFNFKKGKP
jgi:O-antigen/teichoic acid export membrane protein